MRRRFNRQLLQIMVLLLINGIRVFAQNGGAPNDLDKNYVPDKNSIFNSAGKTGRSSGDFSPEMVFHNTIHFNPGLLLRNIAALAYERRFSEWLGVQAGLGLVYGTDHMLDANYQVTGSSFSGSISQPGPDRMMENGAFTTNSLYFNLAVRFYFVAHYYDEYYKTRYLEVGLRSYSNTLLLNSVNLSVTGDPFVRLDNKMYYVCWGRYLETPGKKISATHHFFIGTGIVTTNYDSFSVVYQSGGADTYQKNGQRSTVMYPAVLLGYEFGIAWK